jgi:Domain of unknown function (DUF4391)
MSWLFAWPEAGRVGATIAREKLFSQAGGGKAIRALYQAQVERIEWAFKLFERSVNLPPTEEVAEIQVFRVHLRGPALDDRVLAHLDKALPRQTWFELVRPAPDGPEIAAAAAYKRRSDADPSRMVALEPWRTQWVPATDARASLPPAVSLEGLYAALLRSLWPYGGREGETVRAQAERLSAIAAQAKAVKRLEGAVRREPDFARRVEKNRELRAAEAALGVLTD